MAVAEMQVEGLDALLAKLEENKDKDNIFVYYTGSIDPNTGESWCPDCVKAEPVIEKGLAKIKPGSVFILCHVGDRPTWKDPQCVFRTHPKLQLKGVPTLMKWNTPQRLGDEQCADLNLVEMLFEEDSAL